MSGRSAVPPGSISWGNSALAKECKLLLAPHVRNERWEVGGIERDAPVSCPALAPGGCKVPPDVDLRQADGNDGLTEGEVKLSGHARPSCDPDQVAEGCSMPAGDDSGQEGGREGLTLDAVASAPTCEERTLYTGRSHVLMQQDLPSLPEGDAFIADNAPAAPPQECAADEEPEMLHKALPASFAPGTGPCTLSGGGRRQDVVPDRQRGAGVWSSSASEGQGPGLQAAEDFLSIPVSTWNLAGAGKKKVKGIITTALSTT